MNTDSLNIMNLLLGNLNQTADPASLGESKSMGESQGTGFDMIFDQLLMSIGEAGEEAGSIGLISDNPEEVLLNSENQIDIIQGKNNFPKEYDLLNNEEITVNSNIAEDLKTGINIIDTKNDLPTSIVSVSELTNNIFNNSLIDIDGSYEVQNWNINGENVNFELISDKNPGTVIKVTISAEDLIRQFGSINKGFGETLNRIQLDGQKEVSVNQLKELLEKYDIKEFNINLSKNTADTVSNKEAINVEIFARNAGQEIILKSKLNKNAIQINNDKSNLIKALSIEKKTNEIDFESGQSKFALIKQNPQSSPLNLTAKIGTKESFSLLKQFMETSDQQGKDIKADNSSQLPNFIKSPTEMTISKDKVDLQPVRFTLPDNINAQLKPNGKSVRINIEPDHLGPARLSLNLQNDKLRAIVTVNSTQAKMTVEGSLDKLLDTLSKANIQVDYIDVNVSQQNSYEQYAQQKPEYLKRQSNSHFSLNDYLNNENPKIETLTPRSVSYVNANGVNLTV